MKVLVLTAVLASFAGIAAAQTPPPIPPDPHHMSRAALEAEVVSQRPYLQNGGVTPSRPAGCTAAEHHQLDFWIGEWDVSPAGSDMVLAESTIRAIDQGCTIFEEWRPFQGPGGHSLSDYDAADSAWHQTWIDGAGVRTMFSGHFENGAVQLDYDTAPPAGQPATLRRRMSYQPIDANTVRQWGSRFNETTQAWEVTWDLIYKRRAGTRP